MIVTLISPDEISTISLPERISGRYWIFGRENNGQTVAVADIEGIQDQWYIHGSPDLDLLDGNGNPVNSLPISTDKQVLNAKYRKTGTVARLYVDRKSTRLNSSHTDISRMPSSA